MNLFLCGVLVGAILTWCVMAALYLTEKRPLVIDRYWLEDADRWEWLRQYERAGGEA